MMAHELFEKLGYLRELDDDYIVYVEKGYSGALYG